MGTPVLARTFIRKGCARHTNMTHRSPSYELKRWLARGPVEGKKEALLDGEALPLRAERLYQFSQSFPPFLLVSGFVL